MPTPLPAYFEELKKHLVGSNILGLIDNFSAVGKEAEDYRRGMLAAAFSGKDPDEPSEKYKAGKDFIAFLSKFEANYRTFMENYSGAEGACPSVQEKEAADLLHSLCQILLHDSFGQQALGNKDLIEKNCWQAACWLAQHYPKNRMDGKQAYMKIT